MKFARFSRGILVGSLLLAGLLALFSSQAPPAAADPGWWDSNYQYRAPITLDTNENVPENYQYRIVLDKVDNLNSHCLDNFQDVRFTENEDGPELSFWIENYISGDNAIFWVRREDNSLSDNQIYVYYGNSGAASAENGEDTFLFFDDFSGTTLDATRWTAVSCDNTVSGGILTAHNTAEYGGIRSTDSVDLTDNIMFETRAKVNTTDTGHSYGFFDITDASTWWNTTDGNSIHWYFNDSAVTYTYIFNNGDYANTNRGTTDTDWHLIKINLKVGETPSYWIDSSTEYTESLTTPSATMWLWLPKAYTPVNKESEFDWVRTRKFVSPEPTASVGSEESAGSSVSIAACSVDNALVDRKQDASWTSPVLATQISADVRDNDGRDGLTLENTRLWIYDGTGATVVDNEAATSYENIDENTKRFYFPAYNPADSLPNANLGGFDVKIIAYDNTGDNADSTYSNKFTVSDFDNTVMPSQENIAGHRHRIYGTAVLVTGGSVTLTAGRRIDNSDGTENAAVSGADFENTWVPSGSGTVYFELETAELDGRTDNLSYAFPNISPEVIYYSSSEAIVDRKKDDPASSPTLTTNLKIRIRDNDNRLDLDSARLLVRDATDAIQENSDVWSTATVVDENTLEFTLTGFDPTNTLADGALGSWDVGGSATDKYGGSVLGWDTGTFVVDDLTVSGITFTPENADLGITWGYDLTVSATVTRVSGTVSLDNSWVDDAAEGTFNAGSGASVTYLIDGSDPGDTVSVDFRAWDSPLDGNATSSYTLTENRVYNWAIYYEENAESYSLLENRTYTLNVYFADGTGEHETISSNSGQVVLNKPVLEISIDDDNNNSDANDYWRTLIPQLPRENLDFLLVGPEDLDSVREYTFTLTDYTGKYGPDENGFVAFKKTPDHLMTVSSEYWSSLNSSASQFLIQGTRYQVVLYGAGGQVRDLHWFTATSTYVQDITVRPLTPENAVYIRDLLSWAAWREEQTIYITYYDGFENTENVTISIYAMGTNNCVFSTTEYLDNVEIEFSDAENEQSYRVELDAWHGDFGHLTETKTVGPNLSGYAIPPPSPFDIGAPISLMALLSVAIVALVALTFGGLFAPQAMLAIAATVSLLILVGWLQLDWKIAAFLWVIGFVFLFGRSKG